jgi:thiol-disulfide isomerase/thioredoxin
MRFTEVLKRWSRCCVLAASLISPWLTVPDGLAQQVGAPAPAWALPHVDGRMVYSSNFAGKIVLLNFFTTWCTPCILEVPEFVALQNEYASVGLTVVAVNIYEEPSTVQSFINAHGINYPVCVYPFFNTPASTILTDYQVTTLTRTVLIDRNNVVVGVYVGYRTLELFEDYIRPLLVAGPPPLSFQRQGRNFVLSWSTNAAGYVLEANTTSLTSATWVPVTSGLSVTNGAFQIKVPFTGSGRYFRLRK